MTGLVVLPWAAYNTSRYEKPVFLSTQLGTTMRIANCLDAYYGARLGYFDERCYYHLYPIEGDESERDLILRERSIQWMREHASRVPIVMAARQGRTWSVFRPIQQTRLDQHFGRSPIWMYHAGLYTWWLLAPAAIYGAVLLRRRGISVVPIGAYFVIVVLATFVTLGQPRVRAPAEVGLVILAAVAIDHLWQRRAERREAPTT